MNKEKSSPSSRTQVILTAGPAIAVILVTLGLFFAAPGTRASDTIALGIMAILSIGVNIAFANQRNVALVALFASVIFACLACLTAKVSLLGDSSANKDSNPSAITHYYLRVNPLGETAQNDQVPTVGCTTQVSGKASLPPHDGVVIAYRNIAKKNEWYLYLILTGTETAGIRTYILAALRTSIHFSNSQFSPCPYRGEPI